VHSNGYCIIQKTYNLAKDMEDFYFPSSQPKYKTISQKAYFNPSNPELNPTCHLLALFGAHHILYVSRIRVNHNYKLDMSLVFT
jgi:hypothetical protein